MDNQIGTFGRYIQFLRNSHYEGLTNQEYIGILEAYCTFCEKDIPRRTDAMISRIVKGLESMGPNRDPVDLEKDDQGYLIEKHYIHFFGMIHELHRMGYQKIRICPTLAPNGRCWRCVTTVKENTSPSCGAMLVDYADISIVVENFDRKKLQPIGIFPIFEA